MTESHSATAEREKRRASLVSVLTVLGLIVLKVTVGLLTGSLGVLAQAADSVLDMAASVLAFFAVRAADQPPDAEHPYGHGKVENLAALVETLLLLATSGWIAYEAVQRLFFRTVVIEANAWGIGVMLLSIGASLALSRYLMRVARRHRSQSLEGNALNFRTDVLSSSVVLLGLGLVWLSRRLGPGWNWLAQADPLAALVVTAFVLRVSLRLGWRAVSELLDRSPPGLTERIVAEVAKLPEVLDLKSLRARQSGAAAFVDLVVGVDRSLSLEEAHLVASEVQERVLALVPEGDVIVHVDPVAHESETLLQTVSAAATRLGLRAHNIHAHEVRGHYYLDLHVEVPGEWSLRQAHEKVSQMEQTLRNELPHLQAIHSHIEPRAVPATRAVPLSAAKEADLKARIGKVLAEMDTVRGCSQIHIRPGPSGYDVVLHCLADRRLPIVEAHRLADRAEKHLQLQIPGISQVLVHMEPDDSATDNTT
jgi:cation diffusion facilitator family transporter